MRVPLCAVLFSLDCLAWHHPVHVEITRAALETLPQQMRLRWAPYEKDLIARYCVYPDLYTVATGARAAEMRPYCETSDGTLIPNVAWRRAEDLRSIEHTLHGMIREVRTGNLAAAAQYAGVLAHLLEDSTCPAHALLPSDSPLEVIKEVMPPPPEKQDIQLHALIERSAPAFDLGPRRPRRAGDNVAEAARGLLERCYEVIRDNRAGLLELVRAAYAGDELTMNRYRRKSAMAGAELVADAYYTAFALAGNY